MDLILTTLLQPWRLEARKKDGDWYHDLQSGTECWKLVKHLGSGTFGDVSQERCVSASSQNTVRAVKRINKRQAHFSQSSRRELEALITFSDTSQPQYQQHFVRFLGWFEDPADLYIAMEFIQHGNLQQYIDQGVFPEPEAASVTAQVARALQYMHQKHFVHRDLKPMNILVSQMGPQWGVKVADFGIAKQTVGTVAATQGIGTPGYMAPELFGSSEYTSAVDVWALGAVAFCMRTGFPPFRTHMELLNYHRDQTRFPVRALGSSSGFCMNFVLGAMTERPERRLTIEQVLAHDWLVIHGEETQSQVDPHTGAAAASTWGIEPRNAWSDTYNGASTVPQSLPTVVPRSSPQDTGPWRTQSMPVDSLPRPKSSSPSPFMPPSLVDATRPRMPHTETMSSTTSLETASSRNTNATTLTSVSAASASPSLRQLPSRPSSTPASSGSYLGCKTCGKKFKKREYLIAHAKANYHTPEIEAEMQETEAAEPPIKVSTQASNLYLTCRTCGKVFKKREYLMGHAKANDHQPEIGARVDTVKRTSKATSQTESHSYLACKTCGKSFIKREYLMAHAKANSHTPEVGPESHEPEAAANSTSDPYLTCGTCGQDFTKREYLMRHVEMRDHTPRIPANPRLTCLACGSVFTTRSELFEHLDKTGHARNLVTGQAEAYARPERSSQRGGYIPYEDGLAVDVDTRNTCLVCRERFRSRTALFEHLRAAGHAR
ncbi:kinase-like domain-containing protein [Xylaria telfairii]|nr:kinase-like domain-containing protein [Xylaria telfairii]